VSSVTALSWNNRRLVVDVPSSIRCFISCSRRRFWTGVSAGVGGIPGCKSVPLSPVTVRVRTWVVVEGLDGSPFLVRGDVRSGGRGKKLAGRYGASGHSML